MKRGAPALIAVLAAAPAALAAEPACHDVQVGERWVCCLAEDGLRCVPNPVLGAGSAGDVADAPATRAGDFVGPRAVFLPRSRGADEIAILGDAYCERREGRISCAPDLARANQLASLIPVPGPPAAAMSAGVDSLAMSFHRTVELTGKDQRLCLAHTDGSVSCHWRSWTRPGEAVRKLGSAPGAFRQVATGHQVACGLDEAGRVSCWFLPESSSANPYRPLFPVDALGTFAAGRKAVALAAFTSGVCAALQNGDGPQDGSDVLCWGYTKLTRPNPVRLPRVRALSMGREAVCALLEDGGVRCWRAGARDSVPEAPRALPSGARVSRLAVGSREACAIHDRGLTCWRTNPPAGPAPVVAVVAPPPPAAPPPVAWQPPPPPPRQWLWHVAVPFSWGRGWYATRERSASGAWLRFRPEILWGPEKLPRPSTSGPWAVGPYAELAWHPVTGSREPSVGAGVAAVLWVHESFVLAPSLGWFRQSHGGASAEQGVEAGLFAGIAVPGQWGPLMVPHGVRIEARRGLGAHQERSLLVAGEFDALDAVLIPVAFVLLVKADWRFD